MVGGGWLYVGMVFTLGLIFCCVNLPEQSKTDNNKHFRSRRSISKEEHLSPQRNVLQQRQSPQSVAERSVQLLEHPRVIELCKQPLEGVISDEGASISGYKLNKVLVLISQGQTTVKHKVGHLSSPRLNCDFQIHAKTSPVFKVQTFPEVVDIYKNVQRKKGGFKIHSMIPNDAVCREGQLSPLGAIQQILVGQKLSEAYREKLKVLREISRETFLSARSISSESVYQSAVAFLHGFLNEKQFSRMFIEKSTDNFCRRSPGRKCSCSKADYLKQQMSKSVSEGFHLFKDRPKQDEGLNSLLGIENSDVSPRQIVSYLSGWLCDQGYLPCQDRGCLKVNETGLSRLFGLADSHVQVVSNDDIFSTFAQLHSRPFLSDVFHWLLGNSKDDSDFLLYSSDESFLSFVLRAVGIEQMRLLPPSSRLVFEVLASSSPRQPHSAVLRVILNGRDVTKDLSFCPEHDDQLCDLQKAFNSFESKSFNGKSYEEECLSN